MNQAERRAYEKSPDLIWIQVSEYSLSIRLAFLAISTYYIDFSPPHRYSVGFIPNLRSIEPFQSEQLFILFVQVI